MDSLERFLTACRNELPDRPPIWLLRQAGRYLPEYRRLRRQRSFEEILSSPELAARVTLQPIKRFGFDAAIIFSDILVIPKAVGVKVSFHEKGVALSPTIENKSDLRKLRWLFGGRRFYAAAEAIKIVRSKLGKRFPIIGFAGAPFTLACYMIEGNGEDPNFVKTRIIAAEKRTFLKELLERISDLVIESLEAQVEASADVVMLFDSLAEILDPANLNDIALPYTSRVVDALRSLKVPVVYYIRGTLAPVDVIASCGADVYSVDWRRSLAMVKESTGGKLAVQGNLDPAVLFSDKQTIKASVRRLIEETGGKGHIVNLGAGIFPNTPLSGVATMVEAVKSWSTANK